VTTVRAPPTDAAPPYSLGWPAPRAFRAGEFVLVVDDTADAFPEAGDFIASARAVHRLDGRPTVPEADAILDTVARTGVSHVASLGAGLVIDAVKVAVFRERQRSGITLVHAAVPCGPEPYRAVTPFGMYDSVPGVRDGVWEDWLRPPHVSVVPELLARLDATTVALFAGDSFVHAVESMLSKLSNAESESHASSAARVFVVEADAAQPDRVALLTASMRAAIAFDTTKLGLAHALSRPLGIAAGRSHDVYNLMLGAPTVRFWGSEVVAKSGLARLPVEPTAEAWATLLDRYRIASGLPETLAAAGRARTDLDAAVAWAPNSSGIPNLPRPLAEGDLERLIATA
jgi:alcohol dehydrogenase